MSISKKKDSTLVYDFLKNPKEFESYVNGCLNSIKKINYLKDVQFDESVDNYKYFKCFSGAIPFDLNLAFINDKYRKEIYERLPKARIFEVMTNVFYINYIKNYSESNRNTKEDSVRPYFSRMKCVIYLNDDYLLDNDVDSYAIVPELLNEDKVFSINELINLSNDNVLTIIDNYVVPDDISVSELKNGIKTGSMVLQKATLNWLDLDVKVFADYMSCSNEYDRIIWQTLYNSLFNYIRSKIIYCSASNDNDLGYNLHFEFYQTIEHLENIFLKIESAYRKKKKILPAKYANIIKDSRIIIEKEKNKFHSISNNTEYRKNI